MFSTGEDLPDDYGQWLPKKDPGSKRRAGVILHPTSLQGPYGIGDFGEEALRFVDWLHLSGCSVWQVIIVFFSVFVDDLLAVLPIYMFSSACLTAYLFVII